MKFKIDENLPVEITEELRLLGHDADSVKDEGLSGCPDSSLMKTVEHEQRIFCTLDKGIADIRKYPPSKYAGIVLFRPPSHGKGQVLEFVKAHLKEILSFELKSKLAVISESGLRIRQQPLH